VLERVGERLLDDPVDRQAGRVVHAGGVAVDGQLDPHAAAAHLLHEGLEVGDGGHRRPLGAAVLVVVQHADEAAHLGEGLPASGGDRAERLDRRLRALPRRVERAVRLHDDHRQAVRDHVVHLAGDPGTLGGRGDAGLLLGVALQLACAVLEPGDVALPGAPQAAQRPREQHHGGQQREGLRVLLPRRLVAGDVVGRRRHPPPGRQPGAEQAGQQPGPAGPDGAVRGDGVEPEQEGHVAGEGGVDQQHLRGQQERERGEAGHRPGPAHQQRGDERRVGEQPQRRAGPQAPDVREQHRQAQREHDLHVDDVRATAQPRLQPTQHRSRVGPGRRPDGVPGRARGCDRLGR
jgi:hypothetical protein